MISLYRIDLTWFSRLLARHVPRRGLVDHKWTVTQSSGRENQAFGGLIWHHQMTRYKEIML